MSRTVTLQELAAGVAPRSKPLTVPVVDLYAGVGGFSTGAVLAGHRIAIAVDAWPAAVHWHAKNHPDTDHYGYSLPDPRLLERLPPPNTLWHLHGSPPCQLLSKSAGSEVFKHRWDEGLDNVRYYLNLAHDTQPVSFSMEQVANQVVVQLIREFQKRYPGWIDYEIVHMEEYGLPQARKRLIAGSCWLIQRLRDTKRTLPRKRARDAFNSVPEGAAGIKGQTGTKGKSKLKTRSQRNPVFKPTTNVVPMDRRVHKGGLAAPSPTVLCSNVLIWAGKGGKTIRSLTLRECAALQTFPVDYKFPDDDRAVAQRLCGNSVPPAFAQHLMSDYRPPAQLQSLGPATFPDRPGSPSLRS